jgi:hypothetical protein
MTKCKGCEATFAPKDGKEFCSGKCRTAYWTAQKRGWLGKRREGRPEHRRWLRKFARLRAFGEDGAEAILREAEGRRTGTPWPDAATQARVDGYMDAAEETL